MTTYNKHPKETDNVKQRNRKNKNKDRPEQKQQEIKTPIGQCNTETKRRHRTIQQQKNKPNRRQS